MLKKVNLTNNKFVWLVVKKSCALFYDFDTYSVALVGLVFGRNAHAEDSVFVDGFYIFLRVFVEGDKVFLLFDVFKFKTAFEVAGVLYGGFVLFGNFRGEDHVIALEGEADVFFVKPGEGEFKYQCSVVCHKNIHRRIRIIGVKIGVFVEKILAEAKRSACEPFSPRPFRLTAVKIPVEFILKTLGCVEYFVKNIPQIHVMSWAFHK